MTENLYHKDYYNENKERILERRRQHYKENREKILERNRKWHHDNPEKSKAISKNRYWNDRQDHLEKCKSYRQDKKSSVDAIALHYGCQNTDCSWKGKFLPCQLDFHHLDPNSKVANVSQLLKRKKMTIATEINKCVVLCRNCHQAFHDTPFMINESQICRVDNELKVVVESFQS